VGSTGQRERTCACSKKTAPIGLAHWAAGERGGGGESTRAESADRRGAPVSVG
jgi:hypothetical protein